MLLAPPAAPFQAPAPQVDKLVAAQRAHAARLQGILEWERCRRSCLYYVENYCWTMNERSRTEPLQRLVHGPRAVDPETLQLVRDLDGSEDDFLRYLTILWETEPLLAIPKSRQMRISHWSAACHGWLAQFYPGQKIAVQSKNHEDADAMLERIHVSWEAQRKLAPHLPWPTYKRIVGRIIPANGSLVMAIAQGADKLRSYTFSAIMSDEMAFQNLAEEAYTAALPTIEGGGKYTAISSAHPSFFQKLVLDKIGAK